jgi:RimJ/RimL family protein N-acetyltransferase
MDALKETILPAVFSSNNYLYSTLWTIVHKEKNQMVADFCFKGTPGQAGEIEIGYGTYEEFQGQGLMTEALGAMIEWAFRQPNVNTILAETDQSNEASHKILTKNNFKQYKVVDAMIWWKLEKPLS